jgi:hypothetical protein
LYFSVPNANTNEAVMIGKTNMSIDMYLRDAGIGAAGTPSRNHFNPLTTRTGLSFSEGLTTAISMNRSGSGEKEIGLTIADYLEQAAGHASTVSCDDPTIRNGWFSAHNPDIDGNAFRPSTMAAAASTPTAARMDVAAGEGTVPRTERQIADSIKKAAIKYNLPEKLIKSVIQAESNFQADAVSSAGAQGLMQLMPSTAEELGVKDPFDIQQNIDGGAAYLRRMLDRFGQNLKLALAAYNAGPGTVEKYNGAVPYLETRDYVDKVLKGASV